MQQIGKTIELYLMDGDVAGRWMATLQNWNCYSYKIPRNDLKNCDDIPEINSPGVYFLFGRDDESGRPFVYVGEGDNVAKRIMQPHSFEKDGSFWTEVVIYITPDGSLDKARIKYLENRFHALVNESDRYIVKNGNTPPQPPFQKKVRDLLEEFIINARLLMLALGHKVFEPQPSATKSNTEDELFYFSRNQGKGGKAFGKIADDGFWVLKGSYINPQIASYLQPGLIKKRQQYANDIDKKGILQKDICFGSPSYASSFVCGRNSNGLVEWKNKDGKTLKEINDNADEKSKKSGKSIKTTGNKANNGTKVSVDFADDSLLHLSGKKYVAFGIVQTDCFIVKKGSQFALKETSACSKSIIKYRQKLIDEGCVVNGIFVHDVKFNSPSTAAACINGINTNGRTAWLNKDGKTLKQLQEAANNK